MKFTKTIEVKNIFNKISYKYDFLNNLLSFGLHRLWKRKLVNLLEPLNGEDWACLLYTSPSPRDAESSRMPSSA